MLFAEARRPVANVSLLTDLVIANLPAEGLRCAIRTVISLHPEIVKDFTSEARGYLLEARSGVATTVKDEDLRTLDDLKTMQKRIRSMIGCGLRCESFSLLAQTLRAYKSVLEPSRDDPDRLRFLVSMDGDMAHSLSLVQARSLMAEEKSAVQELLGEIQSLKHEYQFDRSWTTMVLLMPEIGDTVGKEAFQIDFTAPHESGIVEVFQIGNRTVPRMFCGLWQLSSSAWGSSSLQKVMESLAEYFGRGYTAFDMADQYGDVEAIFGKFRSCMPEPDATFAATKYCVFDGSKATPEDVQDFVSERLRRLRSRSVDLLQLHWQNYSDLRYLDVLKILQGDDRVSQVGLCNFDAEHFEAVLREQIDIKTNQVQFSLIDSRPTVKMADVCEKYGVKLLTYGTLCGGFLSDSWIGKPKPSLFTEEITPSQRKYFEMILSWGGWSLFQTLLVTLSAIAKKHNVSVSNVATRWVLDFPYVGAVIVGSRMGISGRADVNLAVHGWHLDKDDLQAIEDVLAQSRREQMFEEIGDCGSEHR